MKQLTFLAFLGLLMFADCTPDTPVQVQEPYTQLSERDSDGNQVVVVKDNDGTEFLMSLVLFNMLMNSGSGGGIDNVRNYHHHHYHNDPGYRSGYDTRATYISRKTNSSYTYKKTTVTTKPDGTVVKETVKEKSDMPRRLPTYQQAPPSTAKPTTPTYVPPVSNTNNSFKTTKRYEPVKPSSVKSSSGSNSSFKRRKP
jgi:hypothetical protein